MICSFSWDKNSSIVCDGLGAAGCFVGLRGDCSIYRVGRKGGRWFEVRKNRGRDFRVPKGCDKGLLLLRVVFVVQW